MVGYTNFLSLASPAIGAVGAVLLFVEFFQIPSYISYDTNFGSYDLTLAPEEVDEYTWIGRIGALLIAIAFVLQFFAVLLA